MQSLELTRKLLKHVPLMFMKYGLRCRRISFQMISNSAVQNVWGLVNRHRKVVAGLVLAFVVLLYWWPSLLPFNAARIKFSRLDRCIDDKLSVFRNAKEHFDVGIINVPLKEGENGYLPFVGNGHIGLAVKRDGGLLLKEKRALSLKVPYYPYVGTDIEGHQSKEAIVTDYRSGLVYKLQCFKRDSSCVSVGSQIYAHRTRPTVLVQDFKITNPLSKDVNVELDQIGSSDWKGASIKTSNTSSTVAGVIQSFIGTTVKGDPNVEYYLTTGTLPVGRKDNFVVVVTIATLKLPTTITVKAGLTVKYHVVTVVHYSIPVSSPQTPKVIKQLEANVIKDFEQTVNIDTQLLRSEHTRVWTQLWSSGFGISYSRAPGALNGDKINATMYYVLSNVPSPIHEISVLPQRRLELEKSLYFPDRCYDGHHLLQASGSGLWLDCHTEEDLFLIVKKWLMTLEKQGCASMLQAGADGVIQAMMLSFGGLKFSNHHLEFNTHPKDLHRDYFFRRINYGNNTHVNITVLVGDDNKAQLYVGLDRNDRPYYACDGGCLDTPLKLSKRRSLLPVKLTEPVTAILYITADKQHMAALKHVIHVQNIVEAPAHEHHIIASHKYGHHYGGLPALFWISIALLITIFHLFLFKLIYNEYCSGQQERYTRGRYNL